MKTPQQLENEVFAKTLAEIINGAFSNPAKQEEISMAIKMGMIPVSELKDGQWYLGYSRNADEGRWDATRQMFFHYRYKYGWREDYVDCVSTETRYAMFLPMMEIAPVTEPLEDI